MIKLRDQEAHNINRDGGRRLIQENSENPYVKLIKKESGIVQSFYLPEEEDSDKTLQEIIDQLNQGVVFEEYKIYNDNGRVQTKPKIIKVILP